MNKKYSKKIEWFNGGIGIAEDYQPTGIHFAFMSKNMEQCHPFVKCKDFLHDAILAHLTEGRFSIYSFTYDSKINPPLDMTKTSILMAIPGQDEKKFLAMLENSKKIVNVVEREFGMKKTTFRMTGEPHDKRFYMTALFTGSCQWMSSPAMISIYSLLLRLGYRDVDSMDSLDDFKAFMEKISKEKHNDANILRVINPKLMSVIRNRRKISYKRIMDHFAKNRIKVDSIRSDFHHRCGVKSLVNRETPVTFINTMVSEGEI